MDALDPIIENIHQDFETRTKVRDNALKQARMLIRYCANTIRAVHREEWNLAEQHLESARNLVASLDIKTTYPDIYFAGYTQDALKEYAEACLTFAMIKDNPIPTPDELGVEYNTYLKGLAETAGELRRKCLDILRLGHSKKAEKLLGHMDDIYAILVTIDYPDAITGGLRRLTDICRGVTERTRGDLTLSLRQERLEQKLQNLERKLVE